MVNISVVVYESSRLFAHFDSKRLCVQDRLFKTKNVPSDKWEDTIIVSSHL